MPLPTGVPDATVTRRRAAVLAAAAVAAWALAIGAQSPAIRAQSGPAYFVRSLHKAGAERREARPEILDTPVLPGSVMKVVTLAAALESQVIEPDTARMCRRTVTVNGVKYTCSHPDLKRPLTPAEALAHSCNDFFVSLAPRLTRAAFNDVRRRLGLPLVPASADLAASFVGLDGPRLTPRTLLDVVARLAGADPDRPVTLRDETRHVLREGLRGAAEYGTASSLGAKKIAALAKTGTAPMPGGSWMGIAVALTPASKPTRGVVVVAPGAAGLNAAEFAADLLTGRDLSDASTDGPSRAPEAKPARGGGAVTRVTNAPADPVMVRVSVAGRVTSLDLEDYIAQVVAGEGQPKAAAGAQEALAITARTFAVANLGRHRREGYDFCDTTHCQVVRPATDTTRRAARATAGRVLVHQGQPASVFYSAWCGGRSELASEVWPGAIDYVSGPHVDEACSGEPGWTSEIPARDLERALRAAGYRGDRLRGVQIVRRNASGRVSRMRIDGFRPAELSGHDFRTAVGRALGWQQLKSTAFELRRTSGGYRFTGRGFGHGVGLCVIGAGHRAAAGSGAEEILKFYFPTLAIASYGGSAAPVRRVAAAPANDAAAPAKDDVAIALPAGEEGERAYLARLVRDARDSIAAAAGVTPPPTLRVTVHPTVDAFARATGQPWWVSGASDGTAVDLLPLTILRRRGQLERTVRHEVAHVLLDRFLDGRPLWVREGAAFYFADPNSAAEVSGDGDCPRDEEFLRPLSAGTHRAAYARAEACFRRAIARGRTWRDVR